MNPRAIANGKSIVRPQACNQFFTRYHTSAITRELNSLTPQELQNTITEFKQMNTGSWLRVGINATENKSATGEVGSIDFVPVGYLGGNAESFNIKLK